MSFIARVYRIMIGAPSDIKEEVQIAKDVINEWNYVHTELHHKVLLPLHWSISAIRIVENIHKRSLTSK